MRKTVAVILACALLGSTLPVPALAAETDPTEEASSVLLEEENQGEVLGDGTAKELIGNGTCGDNLNWELDSEGTLTISGTGEMADYGYRLEDSSPWYSHGMEIRSIVMEEGITRIGDYAFAYCSNVTGVVEIPQSVTEIGGSAFYYCTNLTGVTFSSGVVKLENNAFGYCKSLETVELPPSVAYVGFQAFANCTGLQEITFRGSAPVFGADSSPNVFKNVTATAYYPGDNITWTENIRQDYGGTITWTAYEGTGDVPPEGTGEVVASGTCGDNLTWELDSVGTLTISGTGEMADYGYRLEDSSPWYSHGMEIRSIVMEEGITRIGDYAFYYCTNVTGVVEIPQSVTEIGLSAFLYCTNLTEVTFSNGVVKLENNAFAYCNSLEAVELPASVAYVGFQAFVNCTGLQEITFRGSAPVFGTGSSPNVFKNVTATAYYPGDNITWTENIRQAYGGTITWTAYEGTGEVPPEGTGEVVASGTCGDNLTWELDSYGTLTISGTGDMYDYWYDDATPWENGYEKQIRTIVLEKGITSIGDYAFNDCTNVTGIVEIPQGVTEIGASAFSDCENLTGVVLPNGILKLGNNSFNGCESLKKVELPASVTNVGFQAFADCTGLQEISFQGSAPIFGTDAFKAVVATAYYPEDNSSWTENIKQGYGGTITWTAYEGEGEVSPGEPGEVVASGTCGDNLNWELDSEGTLTISGTGEMADYGYRLEDSSPWYSYKTEIKSIVMEEGITRIGDYAFAYCSNVTGVVEIPQSVTEIGGSAFYYCTNLTEVTFSSGVVKLENNAFGYCKSLETVELPPSVAYVGFQAFADCTGLQEITFRGSAPIFGTGSSPNVFKNVTATAYYPGDNITWTENIRQAYGGTITWTAYEGEGEVPPGEPGEVVASGTCGDNLTWKLDSNGTLTISGTGDMYDYWYDNESPWNDNYQRSIGTIVLEEGITSIGDYAFNYCTNVTGIVEIPQGVTKIGASAFSHCENLAGVVLPDGVLKLENNSFNSCENLKKVELPASVAYMEFQAFADCTGLKEITFRGNAPVFGTDSSLDVFKNVTATAYYPGDNITWTENIRQGYGGTITWTAYEGEGEVPPEGTVEVVASGICGDNLTWELDSVGTLTISGTGDMYDYSYSNSSPWKNGYEKQIRTIVLEEGITSIGDYAFNYFSNVTGIVEIPQGVTEIGASAFNDCENLAGVVLPDGVLKLGNNSFNSCENLKKVELPASVAYMEFQAFADCTGLQEITFRGSAPVFGTGSSTNVFNNVTATVYYPGDNITWTENIRQSYGGTITWTAYEGTGEVPPEGIGEVVASGTCGDNLNWELDSVGTLTISGTGDMYDYSYNKESPWQNDYKKKIRTIVLEEGMTSIGDYAFNYCTNVTGIVEIPQGVTEIGASAFSYCQNLAGVVLPDGVLKLEVNSFNSCENLKKVELPASVTSVGYQSFANCPRLREITFLGDAPAFGTYPDSRIFKNVTATAYYPLGNETWTEEVMKDYGGTITWMENLGGDDAWGVVSSWEVDLEAGYLLYDKTLSDEAILADLALDAPKQAIYKGVGGVVTEDEDGAYEQVFTFADAQPGTYKLAVYKTSKYVPQIVEVTIGEGSVTLGSVKLCAYGDINGDGRVNTMDVSQLNGFVKQVLVLTEYQQACANVNGDTSVNTMDVSLVNAHVKNIRPLW